MYTLKGPFGARSFSTRLRVVRSLTTLLLLSVILSEALNASVTDTVASTDAVFPPTNYTGIGVKVGVIEAAVTQNGERYGVRFDPYAPQLTAGSKTFIPNVKDNVLLLESVVHDHATAVVSVLVR